jgi:hypothetical protein
MHVWKEGVGERRGKGKKGKGREGKEKRMLIFF